VGGELVRLFYWEKFERDSRSINMSQKAGRIDRTGYILTLPLQMIVSRSVRVRVIPIHCLHALSVRDKQIKTTPDTGPLALTPFFTVVTLERQSKIMEIIAND
jgi:hypothetical protein